jgi:hypothetical protein
VQAGQRVADSGIEVEQYGQYLTGAGPSGAFVRLEALMTRNSTNAVRTNVISAFSQTP